MLLLILLFHFLLLGYTSGQDNAGKCKIDNDPDFFTINHSPINDIDTDLILFDSTYTGKLSVLNCYKKPDSPGTEQNVPSYFKVFTEKTNLTIRTTAKLADIDKNTGRQDRSTIVLSLFCTLSCEAGNSTLLIQTSVADTNNHAPEFLEKEYIYKVASPIMPYSDFTVYGSQIVVEDLDFSNKDMTFSVDPDDFDITTANHGKNYTAQLAAKKIIQLTEKPLTYTITATDSEATPKRLSTSQKITIQSDSSKSLDSPAFKNPSYSFDYSVNGTIVTLSSRDGPISLTTNKPESVVKGLKLTGDYKDNFTPKYNQTDQTITLTATPVSSTDSFIILTLSVETDAVATTSIVVYLAGESTPKFSSHVYTATYTVDNTVKLDNVIEVTASRGTPEVTLSGDFKDHFKLNYNSSSKTYDLSVSKKLSGSDLKSLTQLLLTLTATFAGETDQSALIIKLPEHQLQFTSALYNATYDTDSNTVTVDATQPIAFTTAVETIEINASGTYNEYFNITYDAALKNCKVVVKTPLPSNILSSLQDVTLTLSAKDSYEFEARAVLKISIPKTVTEAPEFSSAYYQAQYPKEGTGLFDFESPVNFTNIADPGTVTISLDGYQDNFEVVYESSKWRLRIKKALDVSILEKLSQIVTTLEAKEEGNTLKGSAVLVLELPKTSPEFSETFYTVEYPKNGTGIIEFKNPLDFKNVDVADVISITLSNYSGNFLVEKSSGKWQIKIQKPLDDSILKTNKELIVTMEASGALFTKTGLSVLVMQLPENDAVPKALEFSDVYYLANYPESGTGKINFETKIEFSEITDVSDITIEVSNYTSNFAVAYNTSQKLWQIQINSPLDDSVLESESFIVLTLTAKKKGVDGSGKATLIMNLPSRSAEVAPIFSKSYYVATYQFEASGDPSVLLVDDISITNKVNSSQISIVADEFSDYFEIKNDGKKWSVHAKSPLSASVLKEKTDLVVSIKATDKTNGMSSFSVIDLQLPSVDTEGAPKFSKTFYTAKYSVSDGKGVVTLDDSLEIVNRKNLDKITITTDSKYSGNFKITYDGKSKKWVITVNANLDDSILNSNMDIVMGLTALDSTTKDLGTATLVVTLPGVNIEEPPKFSSIFYHAAYNYRTTVLDTAIKITNKKDTAKVTVTIDKAFEKYFSISLNKTTSIWHVDVVKPLPDAETRDKDLVLTLTATEANNTAVGKAALVLTFPTAILFSKAQYFANYTVEDGKASMTMEDFVITNRESSSNILLGVGDNFDRHFTYHYDNKKDTWKITIRDPFSEEELGDNTQFIMTVIAEDQDDWAIGKTTFIINLPAKSADETAIEFSQVHYEGAYVETEGTPTVNLDKVIQITSNKSLDDLKLTIQSTDINATKYFNLKNTSGNYEITVLEALPTSILLNQKSLVLTLEADLAGIKSYATLVINLPTIMVDGEIRFSKVLYNGRYEVTDGKVTLSVETIQVNTTATDASIDVSIEADSRYKTYFAGSYADGEVTIKSQTDLPEDILKGTHVIPLTLVVAIKGKPERALAVLNIEVSYIPINTRTLAFSQLLYTGNYSIVDKKVQFQVNEQIQVITDAPDNIDSAVAIDSKYAKYFKAIYNNKTVTVQALDPIPDDDLKTNAVIALTLTIKTIDSASNSSAILNIMISSDTPMDTPTLAFAQLLYTGNYSIIDGKVQFQVNEKIQVITDAPDNIDSAVAIDSEYAKYFKAIYTNKIVTVQALDQIPDDVLKTKAFIALKLTIKTKDSTFNSSAVLNIIISSSSDVDTTTIAFSGVLYSGKYELIGASATITYDAISLITNQTDKNIQVVISNGFEKYFSVQQSDKNVDVSVTIPIPTDILKNFTTIAITLRAQIVGTSKTSSAVLNLRIKNDDKDESGSILFPVVLHTGKYSVIDGKGKLAIDDKIQVITDIADSEIETSISDPPGYSSYFSLSYSRQVISVKVEANLPDDVFNDNYFISLTITAGIKNSTKTSSTVLNIKLDNGKDDTIKANFTSFIYNGEYQIADDKTSLRHDPIGVETDQADDSVVVNIENEYAKYFFMYYSNKNVTLDLKNEAPSGTLGKLTNIPVELSVHIKGNKQTEFAVLNLKVVGEHDANKTGAIAFHKVLYSGKYTVSDDADEPKFTIEEIRVITQNMGTNIEITAWDDYNYNQYFKFSYSNNAVSVALTEHIPANVYKNVNFIPITLTAKLNGSEIAASTVLNIEIDYVDHNDEHKGSSVNTTGYVAAIVVLALVLIALIAGAGAFYYFKIRNTKYVTMDDEDFGRSKFDKQARPSSKSLRSSSIEERRPTGYNFNPIFDSDGPKLETSPDPAENRERRKSVAFNENVQKLELEAVNDDDIDKALGDKNEVTSL